MTTPYLSEIRIFSFSFAPRNWAACDGQLLPIQQNQALFSLIGTRYGGDGRTTFALPNLQGRAPVHMGNSFGLGQADGSQTVTLAPTQVPPHGHSVFGTSVTGNSPIAAGNFVGGTADNSYGPLTNATALQSATITSAGRGLPHDNMQPYAVLNLCIALSGIFPSQN